MDTRDAIQEARTRGVDLVEIAPNAQPPVCKLIDYGKFLYEQKKKAHEELSVIDQLTDWRLSVGSNFNEVNTSCSCFLDRIARIHYA